ncbi:hypothetical protein E2562_030012 [Oryza meyeriana var. granulata]|uniref:Uncharacterized protein n=1 Tax=Oryza meyeriana var. granulata TaxID=110450 RepID=A0A6G1E589_9ORYZ|nr:hypothetical protein E2562_030012 [Oryza meyeriana var. granulata]
METILGGRTYGGAVLRWSWQLLVYPVANRLQRPVTVTVLRSSPLDSPQPWNSQIRPDQSSPNLGMARSSALDVTAAISGAPKSRLPWSTEEAMGQSLKGGGEDQCRAGRLMASTMYCTVKCNGPRHHHHPRISLRSRATPQCSSFPLLARASAEPAEP